MGQNNYSNLIILTGGRSKFIHLIRDPRAVVNSQMKAFNKKSIHKLAGLWVYLNYKIINNFKKFNIQAFEIHYEDLVDNPKNEILSLVNFLNLELDN